MKIQAAASLHSVVTNSKPPPDRESSLSILVPFLVIDLPIARREILPDDMDGAA